MASNTLGWKLHRGAIFQYSSSEFFSFIFCASSLAYLLDALTLLSQHLLQCPCFGVSLVLTLFCNQIVRALRKQERSDIFRAIHSGGHMCRCDPFTAQMESNGTSGPPSFPIFNPCLFSMSSSLSQSVIFNCPCSERHRESPSQLCQLSPPPPITMDSDSQESIRPEKYIQLNREGI
jgi:hypothetical protein